MKTIISISILIIALNVSANDYNKFQDAKGKQIDSLSVVYSNEIKKAQKAYEDALIKADKKYTDAIKKIEDEEFKLLEKIKIIEPKK